MWTGRSDVMRGVLLLVAVPPSIVAAGALVLTVLGVFGRNPFWSATDFTMAEAAALRDQATVAALARAGQDPAARVRVRTGMFDNPEDLQMTPAEAAVRADRAEILEVLFMNGLQLDRQGAGRLLCLADEWGSEEVVPYLTTRFPDAASEPCASDTAAPQ